MYIFLIFLISFTYLFVSNINEHLDFNCLVFGHEHFEPLDVSSTGCLILKRAKVNGSEV